MTTKKYDKIETLECGSKIQHGPYNDRIYLMKAEEKNLQTLPQRLIAFGKDKGYGKIFAKLPASRSKVFLDADFTIEAEIPDFYNNKEKGLFLAYFLNDQRKIEADLKNYERNIGLAQSKINASFSQLDKKRFHLRACNEKDLERMAEIYKTVFHSYPFPIHEPDYLKKTMQGHVDYFGIETDGQLIALASAEKDPAAAHAEMTDFATLPEWRGYGFAVHLLKHMEKMMMKQSIPLVFTIARAASPGMNITFAKCAYQYGGRLVNNTNISGKIESMNIWYKKLIT